MFTKKSQPVRQRLKIQQRHQCSQSHYQQRSSCITVTHEGLHVSQMPPLTLRAAAQFPAPKTATPRLQFISVLLCLLPRALNLMQHCRLRAQLSGAGETKHHLLCKHYF